MQNWLLNAASGFKNKFSNTPVIRKFVVVATANTAAISVFIWCTEREPNASTKSLEADRSTSWGDEASRSA